MSQTMVIKFNHPTHENIVDKFVEVPDGEVLSDFISAAAKHGRKVLVDHLFKELKKHPADISWAAFPVENGIRSAESFICSEKWKGN